MTAPQNFDSGKAQANPSPAAGLTNSRAKKTTPTGFTQCEPGLLVFPCANAQTCPGFTYFVTEEYLLLIELQGDITTTTFQSIKSSVRTHAGGRPRNALVLSGASLLAALAFSLPAVAATTPSAMTVSATVQATCLNTVTILEFGTYGNVDKDATAAITVTCTNTTTYNVGLNAGLGVAPVVTVAARHMTGPASAVLNYTLKSGSQAGANWGNTVSTDTVAGIGNAAAQPLTIFGRFPANQLVAPGAYADAVTATVTGRGVNP